jgi:two-component system KDP operon response regulator KdpE
VVPAEASIPEGGAPARSLGPDASSKRLPLVLVVDEDRRTAEILRITLADEGMEVRTASSREALKLARQLQPDVLLVDPASSAPDGLSLLESLRASIAAPIMVLSARGSVSDTVGGLQLGADDYLRKPFNVDELAARIRALLRRAAIRAAGEPTRRMQVDGLEIDLERRLMLRDGHPVRLSRMEWLLLTRLAQTPGRIVLYEDLLDEIWGPAYRDDVQLLRVCVSRLRHKLGSSGRGDVPIRTYVGVGYSLELEPPTHPRRSRGRRGQARPEDEVVPEPQAPSGRPGLP